eukprot:3618629-Amphidinium_carterae.2
MIVTVCEAEDRLPMDSAITIYICTHSAVVLELDVLTSDSVLKLKGYIAAQGGLPVEQQRLMFGGLLLHDDRSLVHGSAILTHTANSAV